jgi:hypothetical protein
LATFCGLTLKKFGRVKVDCALAAAAITWVLASERIENYTGRWLGTAPIFTGSLQDPESIPPTFGAIKPFLSAAYLAGSVAETW